MRPRKDKTTKKARGKPKIKTFGVANPLASDLTAQWIEREIPANRIQKLKLADSAQSSGAQRVGALAAAGFEGYASKN